MDVGPLICFDIEFPEPARELAAAGAELLVTASANMAPFGPDHEVATRCAPPRIACRTCTRTVSAISAASGSSAAAARWTPRAAVLAEARAAATSLLLVVPVAQG